MSFFPPTSLTLLHKQEFYLKPVDIIRAGKYDPDKARFRTFLSLLIRRQLITLYRQDQARHVADRCSIDDLTEREYLSRIRSIRRS